MEPFGISYRPGEFQNPKCERCEQEIKTGEKLVMDRKTIHKGCFKCAICDKILEHGSSGLDNGLAKYGPIWLCRPHLLLDPTTKEQMVAQKGFKQRGAKKK
ncbi:unnamed protein product [Meloidogyne enterolobii]|uniref:Uncharacterized protein n=2 Tax=Meloidogyne enterolobii TaxID=390850 RepID=A0ACB0ZAX3_MELEN|nr:unnamed protein product [Meloidogyne enterolobii]